MKKIFFLVLVPYFIKAQSVLLGPEGLITKSMDTLQHLEISNFGHTADLKIGTSEGIVNIPSTPSLNRIIGSLEARGYTQTQFVLGANINFTARQKWSSTATGSAINFRTKENLAGSDQVRLSIDNDGFVGVKTIEPKANLHLFKGSSGLNFNFAPTLLLESDDHQYLSLTYKDLGINTSNGISFLNPDNFFGLKSNFSDFLFYNVNLTVFYLYFNLKGHSKRVIFGQRSGFESITDIANLEIRGDLAFKKTSFLSGNANFTNFDRQGSSHILVTGPASDMTGIADGFEGLLMYISVAQGTTLRIFNDNINSLPQNRILTNNGGQITISTGGATLIYDGDSQRWRVIGIAQ
jgi:hypothetical protein